MVKKSHAQLVSSFERFSEYASIFVFFTGVLALIGWIGDISVLKSLHPSLVSMKANTAIAIILTGISLYFLQTKRSQHGKIYVAHGSAFVVALIGLLTLIEYFSGWDMGIDQLIFKESPQAVGTFSPGRMAPHTAVTLLINGIALLLMNVEIRKKYRPLPYVSLIGHLPLLAYSGRQDVVSHWMILALVLPRSNICRRW
ncbi:MAG: hypothetical protein U0586_16575 [Candidatus Brocadiaceae bacterium]